mmetsp:Transcript_606/g.1708  ORF Transcript_606/g.1708 Transcript_606/m.1708 type:complete len:224 (-) Transcript_606:568-1239(-)
MPHEVTYTHYSQAAEEYLHISPAHDTIRQSNCLGEPLHNATRLRSWTLGGVQEDACRRGPAIDMKGHVSHECVVWLVAAEVDGALEIVCVGDSLGDCGHCVSTKYRRRLGGQVVDSVAHVGMTCRRGPCDGHVTNEDGDQITNPGADSISEGGTGTVTPRWIITRPIVHSAHRVVLIVGAAEGTTGQTDAFARPPKHVPLKRRPSSPKPATPVVVRLDRQVDT